MIGKLKPLRTRARWLGLFHKRQYLQYIHLTWDKGAAAISSLMGVKVHLFCSCHFNSQPCKSTFTAPGEKIRPCWGCSNWHCIPTQAVLLASALLTSANGKAHRGREKAGRVEQGGGSGPGQGMGPAMASTTAISPPTLG